MAHVWSSKTLDAAELADLYEWLDSLPLGIVRSQVEKDFADGCLAAEVVRLYFPDIVNMKHFTPAQNVQDRIAQWKLINQKVFRRIGLNVPTHVMTQLSIAKTGTAQLLAYNIRVCLTLSGAYTNVLPVIAKPPASVLSDPIVRPMYYNDPMWYKYNLRYSLLNGKSPGIYPDEYEYYWQKRQADRVLKYDKAKLTGHQNINSTIKSFSHPNIRPGLKGGKLPALTTGPFLAPAAVSKMGYTAAQVELDDKNKRIHAIEDEVQYLRGQLKRMEVLLQNKNAKIQELQMEIDKQQRPQRKLF